MAIAIKGWDTLYENSETKKYKHLKWVPIPNKHDGTGWAELWNLRKAPEIFAAFIIMLEIASKCPKRGVIHKDGVSYGPKEMALKSRAPESIFVDAIPALIKIGWIEEIEISGEIRKSSEEPPANRIEQNRTEQNRKTAAAPDTASVPLDFPAKAGTDVSTLADLLPLNLPPTDLPGALGLLKAAPKLSAFPLDREGYAEACLDIIRGMISLHQKHGGAVNLLKALNHYLKDAASPLLICAAVRRLNAMPEAPKSWYAYWRSIMGNPEALRREWEENIWPQLKAGSVKWQ